MNKRFYFLGLILSVFFFRVDSAAFANVIVDFKQSSNNQTSGPVIGLGNVYWINSIIQSSNSKYFEGMSNLQRSLFAQVPATAGDIHTLTFSHQFTKGGIHAYDFLTSYAQGVADDSAALGVAIQINQCGQVLGPPASMPDSCNALHTSGFFVDINIPDDPYISKDGYTAAKIAGYEALHGNRTIRIYGNAPISNAFLTLSHDSANGADYADSYAKYVLQWTSTSSQILVEMAAHLAISGDGTGDTWGAGLGSSQINGGPYHFKLTNLGGALDVNGNQTQVTSLGSQDNQIKGADILIPCPTCTVSGPTGPFCHGSTALNYSVTVNGTCVSPSAVTWTLSNNTSGATFNGGNIGTTVSVNPGIQSGGFRLTSSFTCSNCTDPISSFIDASVLVNTQLTRLNSIARKHTADIDFAYFQPDSTDSVEIGDHVKFLGLVSDAGGSPVPNQPVYVFNSFKFNSADTIDRIDTIMTDALGNFTYPAEDTGLLCSGENFWPFWFAINDCTAIPFLLTVGQGCRSCSVDSTVAALRADTSGLFDAAAVVDDPNDPLVFPMYSYPQNDFNLADTANNAFWAAFSLKYFGPLGGRSFLMNPSGTGWLQKGDSIVAARLDVVAQDLPNYFRTIDQRLKLIALRDTVTRMWNAVDLSSVSSAKVDLQKFKWYAGQTAKKITRFTVDHWDLIACAGTCAGAIFTGVNIAAECGALALGIAKEVSKPVMKGAFSEIACYRVNNPATCWTASGRSVDMAYLVATLPFIYSAKSPSLCSAFGLLKSATDLNSSSARSSYGYGGSQVKWNRNVPNGNYQSILRSDIRKQNVPFTSALGPTSASDTLLLDLYFTLTDVPSFSLSTTWDNPSNPTIVNLNIVSDKILFTPRDTSETLAGLALVNGSDTVGVSTVTRTDDSTYSASIPVSILPNYSPGQKYAATLIANGQDLFSNYGEKHSAIALATITIDGGEITTKLKWKLSIPSGSLSSNTFVTMIPVSRPALGGGFSSDAKSITDPHFLGDVIEVTPPDVVLNSPSFLTLPFDTVKFNQLVDSTVVVARFDSTVGWKSLGGTVNLDSGLVTAPISQFGIFGVAASRALGDLNGDRNLTPADVVLELNCVFVGIGECSLGDVNCDGNLSPADVVLELNAVFLGTPFPC